MSKAKIAKEIKEATKILTYLGRAEKYFDLELVKNGRPVKPLLMIVDIIDPLRQISEVAARVENNEPIPHYSTEAFEHAPEICSVCADIIALNPRGLVSSDKATLSRLAENIQAVIEKAGSAAVQIEIPAPAQQQRPESFRVVEQYQFPQNAPAALPQAPESLSYNYELPQAHIQPQQPQYYTEPAPQNFSQPERQPERYSLAENNYIQPQQQTQQPQPQQNYTPQPQQQYQPQTQPQPANDYPEAKIYKIHPEKRDVEQYEGSYLAKTYPGINLMEAADIIEELARNPKNHNLVLLEHASQIKPIPMGIDIIDDLRALAPIADAIENSSEIVNKEPLKILSKADLIITICNDISALQIEGLDLRKKKLLSKFIRQDISKLAGIARSAYPEAFSPTTDNYGELVTNTLVDFAELLTAKARFHEDTLYAELLSLISYQIAEYSNYNELRTKFDVIIKKNRLNSDPKVFDNKIKMAWLRAVSYVPQIARHSQEIAGLHQTNDIERRLIEKTLEILQLAYLDARDKYAAYLQDNFLLRAA